MVLEHLIEVGSRIAVGIVELTHGIPVPVKADIADVKPKGGKGGQIVQDFRQPLERIVVGLECGIASRDDR